MNAKERSLKEDRLKKKTKRGKTDSAKKKTHRRAAKEKKAGQRERRKRGKGTGGRRQPDRIERAVVRAWGGISKRPAENSETLIANEWCWKSLRALGLGGRKTQKTVETG